MHETSALVVVPQYVQLCLHISQYVQLCLHIQKRAQPVANEKGWGGGWHIWNKEKEDTGGEEKRQQSENTKYH